MRLIHMTFPKVNASTVMKNLFLSSIFLLLYGSAIFSQCVADYDFGDDVIGISPDPYQGETFDPAIVGEPYIDILHLLIPEFILEVDPTLPFSPTTTLDSVQLISLDLVDLDNPTLLYEPEELGLEITCYNNGDSGYPCTFLGNNQYCATVTGTPTMSGNFRADIIIKGFVLVFGFPFGQEELFGSLEINIGVEGCMDETALNFNPEAVIDDGSCLGCYGDIDGDDSVAMPDLLAVLIAYGCSEECSVDFNEDGLTTVLDILDLLTVFGNIC